MSVRVTDRILGRARERKLKLSEILETGILRELNDPFLVKAELARLMHRREELEAILEASVVAQENRRLVNLAGPKIERFKDQMGRVAAYNREVRQMDLDRFIEDERVEEFMRERGLTIADFRRVLTAECKLKVVT